MSFDRSVNHDQFYFDVLFHSNMKQAKDHIKILEAHILNSVPPPMINQKYDHAVLHLMGESNLLRKEVFGVAMNSLCSTLMEEIKVELREQKDVPPSLFKNLAENGNFRKLLPIKFPHQLSLTQPNMLCIATCYHDEYVMSLRHKIDRNTRIITTCPKALNAASISLDSAVESELCLNVGARTQLSLVRQTLELLAEARESTLQLQKYLSTRVNRRDITITSESVSQSAHESVSPSVSGSPNHEDITTSTTSATSSTSTTSATSSTSTTRTTSATSSTSSAYSHRNSGVHDSNATEILTVYQYCACLDHTKVYIDFSTNPVLTQY